MKTCRMCGEEKSVTSFSPHSETRDGYAPICRPCNSARTLKRYYEQRDYILDRMKKERVTNHDRRLAIERKSRAKNKEKNRPAKNARQRIRNKVLQGNTYVITNKDLRRIYSSPCVECSSMENQSMDHVIPLSRGGSHGIGNLITLCLPCNLSKHDKLFSEWRYSKSHILPE